jgi:hypothetical protein
MSEREKHLQATLSHLLQILDYATITFGTLPPDRAQETALEFDEAYVAACEALADTPVDSQPRKRVVVLTGIASR